MSDAAARARPLPLEILANLVDVKQSAANQPIGRVRSSENLLVEARRDRGLVDGRFRMHLSRHGNK